jgi:drug/metabolite transporter (DMT)-like permease
MRKTPTIPLEAREGEPITQRRFTGVDGALLAVVFIWGANFVVMKQAFSEIDPLAFNVVRLTLAAIILMLVLVIREGWQPIPKSDWGKLIWLGLLGNFFYQIPFILGLKLTTPENSSLLIATIPVWAAMLAMILGWERITRRIWTGILLSFAGVLLVTTASARFSFNSSGFWGDLLTLGAAACWAAYTVFSKELLGRYSPLRVSALALVAGVMGLWVISLPAVITFSWLEVPAWAWVTIAYSGALSIALAYVIWATGVKHVGAARTAVYNNLVPVVTFLLAYLAMQQPIMPLQLLGGSVVLLGVWLTVRSK